MGTSPRVFFSSPACLPLSRRRIAASWFACLRYLSLHLSISISLCVYFVSGDARVSGQDGSIHVVLEYMDRGSLSDVIHGWRGMEYGEDLMAAVTFQVCFVSPDHA